MLKTILLTLFSVGLIIAQEKKNDTLSEVVLESKLLQNPPTITPVDIVGTSTIKKYAPIDIVSAINETPSVYIFSGGLNTNRLTIRGMGARTPYGTNKIQAYFNGIPITSGVGESTFNIYDPESLQQIEIIKGPKASIYGANLGGAMLLQTKLPEKNTSLANEVLAFGSYGMFKNSFQAAYRNEAFYINLLSDHLQTDGYRENSSYKRNAILLDMGYDFDDKNSIQFLFNQIDYNAHIASSIGETDFNENPKKAATNWNDAQGYEDNKGTTTGITYKHTFSSNLNNTTTIFYSYLDHYEPRPFNILDEFTNSYGFRSSFNGSIPLPLKNKFTLGAERYSDTYNWKTWENLYQTNNGQGSLQGDLLSDNKEYRNRFNSFGTWSLYFNKLVVALGLNFNNSSYNYRDHYNTGENNKSANRDFDAIWAPSFSIKYLFTPANIVFGNISYGYSYPNLEETLTPEGIINPDIGPETGTNYEIGTENYFFNRKLKAAATFYYMDVENLLVADRVGEDQYIGRNAGVTSHKGFEVSINYLFNLFPDATLQPYLNATFNHHTFEDFVEENNDYSGNDLTGVPKKLINGGVQFKHDNGIYFTATYQHVGSLPMNDANSLYTDAYNLINIKGGYQKQITNNFKLELLAGINNLFDEKYAASILINAVGFGDSEPRYYYPGLPVNYYGGLKLKYLL
ncbi:TonB-dependent receptor family protein [Galbibacter pacificus]|uniref:TonB-dependent receptor n=1 Tax=Galbibacter pacificus TaxID=2996052 RepID=A0ABT6FTM9_9FLAO|nr:TonB-dependent receptor [Galbibacter pacificus]MDG3583120.1 TonB-dependent receptor [Galbibacter pacificus]MDG3586601.1 TonB-dependent receptor [Galbibacter pacificus]